MATVIKNDFREEDVMEYKGEIRDPAEMNIGELAEQQAYAEDSAWVETLENGRGEAVGGAVSNYQLAEDSDGDGVNDTFLDVQVSAEGVQHMLFTAPVERLDGTTEVVTVRDANLNGFDSDDLVQTEKGAFYYVQTKDGYGVLAETVYDGALALRYRNIDESTVVYDSDGLASRDDDGKIITRTVTNTYDTAPNVGNAYDSFLSAHGLKTQSPEANETSTAIDTTQVEDIPVQELTTLQYIDNGIEGVSDGDQIIEGGLTFSVNGSDRLGFYYLRIESAENIDFDVAGKNRHLRGEYRAPEEFAALMN
jgi:hypothetical protein